MADDHPVPSVALSLHDGDTVAVMATPGKVGAVCHRERAHGAWQVITLSSGVPLRHKAVLAALAKGDVLRKYDQPIGTVSDPIAPGAHAHSQNLAVYRRNLAGGGV